MVLFYFLIGVLILWLISTALRWFAEAEPRQLVRAGQVALGIAGGAVILWFVATGKAADGLVLATTLAPFFVRWKGLWTRLWNSAGPTPGGASKVETSWLSMSLDHASGAMDGVVRRGAYRGRRLVDLSLAQLQDLAAECRADGDSAALLETYLDRLHPGWQATAEASSEPPPTPSAAMSHEEAWRILGLEPGAGDKAIREAHRRLMKKLHPDQGGSSYLAAKINQAKDLLLGG